jgi:hypothetical protein
VGSRISARAAESTERRQADVRDQAPAFFLTVVSIIQSFALGFLLNEISEAHFEADGPSWRRLGHAE